MAKPTQTNGHHSGKQRRDSKGRLGSIPPTPIAELTSGEHSAPSVVAADPPNEELCEFIAEPPAVADHVLVIATSPTGDQVVQDRTATECKRAPELVSAQIDVACERWARSERRMVRFTATWMRGEKTLAKFAWASGSNPTGAHELDGSVTSFLQQQQHFAMAQHKLHLEGFEMVQEGWQRLLQLQNKRIEALERDNQELRDRLRKLDDVGSELAIENARAEIEARGRTADLIEKKVIPLAQAVIAQKLQESSAVAPAAAGEHDNGDEKQGAS